VDEAYEEEKQGRFMLWYLGKVQWALSHRKDDHGGGDAADGGHVLHRLGLPTGLRPPPDNGLQHQRQPAAGLAAAGPPWWMRYANA
jgi:hypothetical protein